MALTVRNKIWLGTIFLFFLLILTGGAGIYYTAMLKKESKEVLKDNYESLLYCYVMQQQLDSLDVNFAERAQKFEGALKDQEHNITEPGEDRATYALRADFDRLKLGDTSKENIKELQSMIQRVLYLNMHAIQLKNAKAEKTAADALTIIIALATIVFLISFTFSVNFPSIVSNPIGQLTEAIEEIGRKNYRHRVHIDNSDEFGKLADAFNDMAQRLEYFESSNLNKLMFEKSRAEAVINSLKDASIGIDRNNDILFANYQALQLLGLKAVDVVGKSALELAKTNDLFQFLFLNESNSPFKIVVENRENYFTKETIEVAQGEGGSRVIVLHNITSYKELDVAKTNFIATISHELKTPLAASDFSLKLLEDERTGPLTAAQKELIGDLKQDNQRILKILSELLNMSQIEAGRIQLHICRFRAEDVVAQALEAAAASARDKTVTIDVQVSPDLPEIEADPDKSTWVLNNLLSNAIKYSEPGGVVRISVELDGANIIFSVKDNGPGIAAAYVPRLFERYFQVPGAKAKGTGLGLSISKDFIEAQRGKIAVETEVGAGSTFSFSLPISGHQ